jgi:protein SCO1/2
MTLDRRILLVVCALAAAVLGAWWASKLRAPAAPSVALAQGTLLVPARSIGALDLVDQYGERFTEERLAGRWSVVYFGFTTCPMICPTTMAVLRDFAGRVQGLPPESRPQVILITVDPAHDTPQVLGRYVAAFDTTFLGLSGTSAALAAAADRFSVAHGPAAPGDSIDHSATVFIVDPGAALRAIFTPPHSAATLAEDYERLAGHAVGG